MRYLAVALVLGSSVASAEPEGYQKPWDRDGEAGVFLDVGGGWQRLHPPTGLTYRSQYLRIATGVSFHHFLYLGAAFEIGNIYSAYGKNTLAAAVSANDYTDEGNGSTLAGQVFLGARQLFGIVSVGGELAPTVRETTAGMNFEYAADKTFISTIELHGRADVWVTPYVTAGVMASMDIASVRDFQAALQVGFHVEPYDAMKR